MVVVGRFVAGAVVVGAVGLGAGGAAQERPPFPAPPLRGDIGRLSELATQVVAGTVERVEANWNHDRSRIQTRVTLRVERVLAGPAGERLVFRIPGGTVGGTTITVTEMARFRVGEEALVFLRGSRGRLPSVLGGAMGKLPLERGEDGTLALAFPVRTGVAPGVAGSRGREPTQRLDELERFVRSRFRRNP